MKVIELLRAAALGLILGATALQAAPRGDDPLADLVQKWNLALAEHDLGTLLKLNAPEAMILLADGKVVRGREEIRRFWEELLKQAGCRVDLKEVIYRSERTLVSRLVLKRGGSAPFSGEALGVFEKSRDGNWVIKVLRWD